MMAEAWDQPLVLADGTKIDPSNGKVVRERKPRNDMIAIPSASEAQAIVARTRRTLQDIPLPVGQMNTVAIVLFYKMYGMGDLDIAVATNMTVDQIKNIQKLQQYRDVSKSITDSILEHEAQDIRTFFQQKARDAAVKVVEVMDDDDGVLGFKAAQDILDRAGHRPADVVQHNHTMQNALRIEYVEKRAPIDVVPTDVSFEDVTDGDCS